MHTSVHGSLDDARRPQHVSDKQGYQQTYSQLTCFRDRHSSRIPRLCNSSVQEIYSSVRMDANHSAVVVLINALLRQRAHTHAPAALTRQQYQPHLNTTGVSMSSITCTSSACVPSRSLPALPTTRQRFPCLVFAGTRNRLITTREGHRRLRNGTLRTMDGLIKHITCIIQAAFGEAHAFQEHLAATLAAYSRHGVVDTLYTLRVRT